MWCESWDCCHILKAATENQWPCVKVASDLIVENPEQLLPLSSGKCSKLPGIIIFPAKEKGCEIANIMKNKAVENASLFPSDIDILLKVKSTEILPRNVIQIWGFLFLQLFRHAFPAPGTTFCS